MRNAIEHPLRPPSAHLQRTDYYGATYTDYGGDGNLDTIDMASHKTVIDKLLAARHDHASGPQYNYLDH